MAATRACSVTFVQSTEITAWKSQNYNMKIQTKLDVQKLRTNYKKEMIIEAMTS